MKLSELKKQLSLLDELNFTLIDGTLVPQHFHITEVGQVNKKFIDCGGTIRSEELVSLQLWFADDLEHRLSPKKLLSIIDLSETKLGIVDAEVEVEYQSDTIGKYSLVSNDKIFVLMPKQTDCLASDSCGIPQHKSKLVLADLSAEKAGSCTPGGGCC
jgi:hypothetical protein